LFEYLVWMLKEDGREIDFKVSLDSVIALYCELKEVGRSRDRKFLLGRQQVRAK